MHEGHVRTQELKIFSLQRLKKVTCILHENVSKNHQGGIGQVRLKNKWVEIPESAVIAGLDLHINKMPEDANRLLIVNTDVKYSCLN